MDRKDKMGYKNQHRIGHDLERICMKGQRKIICLIEMCFGLGNESE